MSKITFRNSWLSALIWGIAILLRILGALEPAQPYDIGTFHAWGLHLLAVGPREFFGTIWSDYLPLPILALAPFASLAGLTGWSFSLVFKLGVSVLELGLIFALSRAWKSLPRWPVYLLLLSPALIGDTAFWGQIDSIPALLTLLAYSTSSPVLFGLAVAVKPIMLLLAPVLWFLSLKKMPWYRFPLLSGLAFLATGVPTGGWRFFPHLWERATSQIGTYPFAEINAWNLWSLVPDNTWIPDETSVLGLSARTLGLALFLLLTFLALRAWRAHSWRSRFGPRLAATLLIVFYAFTTRMHERHLLFGLPFLTLASVVQPWLLAPLAVLTLSFTLNLWSAFYWVNHAQTWPVPAGLISLLSWATVLSALALVFVWDWSAFYARLRRLLSRHRLLVAALVLAACLRLVNLGYPSTYIFDEVYHAFTAREYLHHHVEAWEWWTAPPAGVAYEWTHPPVGKYGMVLGMLLFGEHSFGWRLGSAVAGILSLLGLYRLVRALSFSRSLALLSVFLVTLEGLHLVQSRIAMNDVYMLAFLLWSLFLAVKSRWKGAAILYGLALGSKWSALYGLVPLALIYLHASPPRFSLSSLLRSTISATRLILISLSVYTLTFAPFILAGHTWAQFWELHRQMWYYHTHLVATHAYQSTPWEWLFALRPVWYHVEYGTLTRHLYAQANPLILWLGLAALVIELKHFLRFRYLLLYVLYLVFTLPWLLSPRIMFFYHYLPSSVFLVVILASWLSTLRKQYLSFLVLLIILCFLFVSPLYFAIPMPAWYWQSLFTAFPSWK